MPSKTLNYDDAHKSLTAETTHTLTTPLGNAILEIQGELVLPEEKPDGLTEEEAAKYVPLEDPNTHAIRFGKLEIEGNKAVLYIGKTQRLIGDIKDVQPPLALLKFNGEDGEVQVKDVIKKKIIFTGRPLPIM